MPQMSTVGGRGVNPLRFNKGQKGGAQDLTRPWPEGLANSKVPWHRLTGQFEAKRLWQDPYIAARLVLKHQKTITGDLSCLWAKGPAKLLINLFIPQTVLALRGSYLCF